MWGGGLYFSVQQLNASLFEMLPVYADGNEAYKLFNLWVIPSCSDVLNPFCGLHGHIQEDPKDKEGEQRRERHDEAEVHLLVSKICESVII